MSAQPVKNRKLPEANRSEIEINPTHREATRKLLQAWLDDESGYDEAVWPMVEQAIEKNRLSDRKRLCE